MSVESALFDVNQEGSAGSAVVVEERISDSFRHR